MMVESYVPGGAARSTSSEIFCRSFGPLARHLPSAVTNASQRSPALARAACAVGSGNAGIVANQKQTNTANYLHLLVHSPQQAGRQVLRYSDPVRPV